MHFATPHEVRSMASNIVGNKAPMLSFIYWASLIVSIIGSVVAVLSVLLG